VANAVHIGAKTITRFKDSFLSEIYSDIKAHERQQEAGSLAPIIQGISIVDTDYMEAEPVRSGGLQRSDTVRQLGCVSLPSNIILEAHIPTTRQTY